jgi:hypothetical protein
VKDEARVTGDSGTATVSGASPPLCSQRPEYQKYSTATDLCMPVAPESPGGDRVVPEIWCQKSGSFLARILELVGWPQVNDEQTEKNLS